MLHKTYPQSLSKRLRLDLMQTYGAEAPEVLNLWVEEPDPIQGGTLKAHLHRGAVERIVVSVAPKFNWEEGYQRLLVACLDAWGPADSTRRDGP